ncbi:MAG: biotin/lipoyl-containing protein, partial [Pseudomonadota bacterium]
MAQAILVPQVGQDLTEAKVVELHVKLGDRVKKGDLVAVVESEKASFEVEAFAEGTVISLPWAVGDTATVLEPLMHLGDPGEVVAGAVAPVVQPVAAVSMPTPVAAPEVVRIAGGEAPVHAVVLAVTDGRRASPVARRLAGDH